MGITIEMKLKNIYITEVPIKDSEKHPEYNNKTLYHIGFKSSSDTLLCAIIKTIDTKTYQEILIENYKGIKYNNRILFTKRKHAEEALEWVRSLVMIDKLNGGY